MIRGGGKFGSAIRSIQSISRDNRRLRLAKELEPFDKEKNHIEAIINAIDSTILQVESSMFDLSE